MKVTNKLYLMQTGDHLDNSLNKVSTSVSTDPVHRNTFEAHVACPNGQNCKAEIRRFSEMSAAEHIY